MFDISFSEILVIAAVALIVLGPERLPKVARTLGHLLGRAQRYANDVKHDIQREIELDELRKWQNSVEGTARSVETAVRSEMGQFQEAIQVGPQRSAASPPDVDAAFEPPHETRAGSPPKQNSPTEPVQPTSALIQPKPDSTQP
jgi:sec-independent protein translocase protein TatB